MTTTAIAAPAPHHNPASVWSSTLGQLEMIVTRANFDTWLRDTIGLRLEDGRFIIGAQTDFATEWLSTRLRPLITKTLARVLSEVGAKRMVVGHTVQKAGINSACQDRVYRIDVGLSAYYGNNPTQVLEITSRGARVLTAGKDDRPAPTPTSKQPGSAVHSAP